MSPPADGSPADASWERALVRALGLVAGAPLETFDPAARYALLVWEDAFAASVLSTLGVTDLIDDTGDDEPPLAPEPTAWGDGDQALDLGALAVDLPRSHFVVDRFAVEPALDAEVARVARVAGPHRVLRADALGRLLRAHGVAPDAVGVHDAVLCGWVRTDGTLADALRVATWTHGGPAHLLALDPDVEVDEAWRARLDAIEDVALRDHLCMLSLTDESARAAGACALGRACPPVMAWLAAEGHEVIAAWGLGEGEAEIVVVRWRR